MPLTFRLGYFFWLFPCLLSAQIPFFAEDFSTPGFPVGWTTEDGSGNEAQYHVLWEKCEAGAICPPQSFTYFQMAFQDDPVGTATSENGYLYANSDAVNIPGFIDPHLSRLTSAPIDCSEQDAVILYFESHICTFNFHPAGHAQLRVSDDGASWETFEIYPDLGFPTNELGYSTNPTRHWIDISSVAAGQPTVFIQWQWEGEDERAWVIDDVKLFNSHPVYHRAVWGTAPGEGQFDNGLGDWTVNPLFGTDEVWEWEENGFFGDALSAAEAMYFSSASPFGGTAGFNADFYTTGGDDPGPGPFPVYESELISPIIDLSGVNELLVLRFTQCVRLLNRSNNFPYLTAWTYSLDGGNTWADPFNANPGVPINGNWEPRVSSFLLPAEASGNPNFRLKFLFAGDLYGWFIDDVVIARREENDLAVQSNFFALPPSLQTPITALSPIHFLTDVRNNGQNDQPNARAYVEIAHESAGLLFRDSSILGSILPDELIENIQFDNAFLPTETGTYHGLYYVQSDSADGYPLNDSVRWEFIVNDSIFAKELGPTGAFTPSESNDFSYGNCYYIPPGDPQQACFVTFGIGNPEDLAYQKVSILLFEIPEGDADGDLEIGPAEYQSVAFTDYIFLGGESPLITVPIYAPNGSLLQLNPDSYYGVLVRYSSNNEDDRCFLLGSQQYDLQATYVLYDLLDDPRYFSLLDIDNTGTFEVIGLGDSGFDRLPVVRLHLCNNTSAAGEEREDIALEVYPNPATDHLVIGWKGERVQSIIIADATGRIVFEQSKLPSVSEQVVVNVSDWCNGLYHLTVYGSEGRVAHRKFVRLAAK